MTTPELAWERIQQYPPGHWFHPSDIVEGLGVSMQVVREGCTWLEAVGVLERRLQRGVGRYEYRRPPRREA